MRKRTVKNSIFCLILGRNMGVSEDGWTPTSKSNKGSYSMVDPAKLKLTKVSFPLFIKFSQLGSKLLRKTKKYLA